MITARPAFAGLFFILPVLAGCGGSDGPTRYPVTGSITLGGQPLDQGTIQFTPTGTKGIGSGATISNGEYAIPREKGLPPDQYRVMIFSADLGATPEPAEDEMPGSEKLLPERIPLEYNAQSEIVVEVKPEGENKFDFQIE